MNCSNKMEWTPIFEKIREGEVFLIDYSISPYGVTVRYIAHRDGKITFEKTEFEFPEYQVTLGLEGRKILETNNLEEARKIAKKTKCAYIWKLTGEHEPETYKLLEVWKNGKKEGKNKS